MRYGLITKRCQHTDQLSPPPCLVVNISNTKFYLHLPFQPIKFQHSMPKLVVLEKSLWEDTWELSNMTCTKHKANEFSQILVATIRSSQNEMNYYSGSYYCLHFQTLHNQLYYHLVKFNMLTVKPHAINTDSV